jgi:hypothetical protein
LGKPVRRGGEFAPVCEAVEQVYVKATRGVRDCFCAMSCGFEKQSPVKSTVG